MATAVVAEAVKLVPVAGPVLSAMLTYVDSSLQTREKLKEQWQQLQVDLPKLSDQLKQVAVEKSDLVHDLQGVVKTFRDFFKKYKDFFEKFLKRLHFNSKPSEVQEFWELVSKLEAQIKSTSFLMTAEILLEVVKSNSKLDEIRNQNNLMHVMVGEIKELNTHNEACMNALNVKVDKLLDNERIQAQSAEEFRGALADFQSAGSDNEKKRKAKDKLLESVQDWTEQDALKVALLFVRDGGDDVKLAGLDILVQMSWDDLKRKTLLASVAAFKVLLATARGVTTDPATRCASQCLINLVAAEPALFFNKWEKMHKRYRKIVDDGLMEQIVSTADKSIDRLDLNKESDDDQALRVLAELAGVADCKPTIAKAEGIEVLAKLYNFATKNMSTAKTDATVSSLVLLATNALASLAMDATCRATFAEEDGDNIRPLVHFVWSCAALSTEDHQYLVWVVLAHDDGEEQECYGPLLTPFGRYRVTEKVWESENAALKALCALLGDAHCRDAIMKLDTFIDMKSGKLGLVPHARNCLQGWAAFANQVAKGMEDIKTARPWDGMETPRGIRTVGGDAPWPSDRVALSPDLVRAVWNLVDDNETKSGLQAVKNLMEGGSRASVLGFFLFCGQFKILDYDELLDSSAPTIESTRTIEWAKEYKNLDPYYRAKGVAEYFWAACVLMSALTPTRPSGGQVREDFVRLSLEMNEELLKGDEDDRELFVPLVERWVIKTKRSDMNEDCIPFLDDGAYWFTSPPDDSEDEDDDSSSDGDISRDDHSDSDDSDGADTSKHSESSQQRADDVDESDTSKHSKSSQESVDEVVRDPRQECLVRLAKLWSDHEDTIRNECSVSVLREVHTLLPADATIEVVLDQWLDHRAKDQPREIRAKVNGDGSVADLKQLIAGEMGTQPDKIKIAVYKYGPALDGSFKKNKILDRKKLVFYVSK